MAVILLSSTRTGSDAEEFALTLIRSELERETDGVGETAGARLPLPDRAGAAGDELTGGVLGPDPRAAACGATATGDVVALGTTGDDATGAGLAGGVGLAGVADAGFAPGGGGSLAPPGGGGGGAGGAPD